MSPLHALSATRAVYKARRDDRHTQSFWRRRIPLDFDVCLLVTSLIKLRRFLITACTVVQAVAKAKSQSNGKGQISTPRGYQTPERITMKFGIHNYVGCTTTYANQHGAATTWVVSANTWPHACFGFLNPVYTIQPVVKLVIQPD